MQALRPGLRAAVALLLLSAAARGQGFVVSKAGSIVETPEARALVVWREGVETLLLEITARGATPEECAFVIPLPEAPASLEPGEAAAFTTLRVAAGPRIEGRTMGTELAFVFWPLLLWFTFQGFRRWWIPFAFVPVMAVVAFSRVGPERLVLRKFPEEPPAARVEARAVPDATAALAGEGFALPAGLPAGHAVIARLSSPGGAPREWRTEPLLLRFPTREAHLPSPARSGTRVALHVAAREGARCGDFDLVRSARLVPPATGEPLGRPEEGEVVVGEPGLLRLLRGETVLTTLQGVVSSRPLPAVRWEPFRPLRRTLFSAAAARSAALGAMAVSTPGALLLLWLARSVAARGRPFTVRAKWVLWGLSLGVGLLTGASVAAATPVVPVRTMPPWVLHDCVVRHEEVAKAAVESSAPPVAAREGWEGRTNPLTGGPVVEEASPFNYSFRPASGREVYRFHDAAGAPWRRSGERFVRDE